MATSVFTILVVPAGLGLSQANYLELSMSCGIGQIITGVPSAYAAWLPADELPAIYRETVETACTWVPTPDTGDSGEMYCDEYIVSLDREVTLNVSCAVEVLDGIFGEGNW